MSNHAVYLPGGVQARYTFYNGKGPSLRHTFRFRAGTRGPARATARIRGTGRRWRAWLAYRVRSSDPHGPTPPASEALAGIDRNLFRYSLTSANTHIPP